MNFPNLAAARENIKRLIFPLNLWSHISRQLKIVAVLLIASGSSVMAQLPGGYANPLDDALNPIGSLQRQFNRNQLMKKIALTDKLVSDNVTAIGEARIKAGHATTTFRLGAPIAPEKYGAMAPTPAERQAWTKEYYQALHSFGELVIANNGKLDDVADDLGMAFVLAYEVYSGGQKATLAQRMTYTEATRQNILHNALFQANGDQDRQLFVEMHGMDAALARMQLIAAQQSRNPALRDHALQLARDTLAALWPYPVEGLELTKNGFEDRGLRLIREGKAITQFTPPAVPLVTDPQQQYWWREFVREANAAKVPVNDLGLALALCVTINWEDLNGGKLPDNRQFVLTRSGVTRLVLTSPEWQRLSDLEKERKLESVAIATMAVDAEFQRALKPAVERLSGVFLATARANKADQASLRLANIDRVRLKAKANLDSIFPPAFDRYVLNENGFVLASIATQK
jgi:hypothetical protein